MQLHLDEGISVIMPTFNQANFISRAIASLKSQTFEKWELIVIIDGATDETKKIIKLFQPDKRIRLYENQKNEGIGKCLNIGLASAQYNFIAYLPSDDVIYKDHLESLWKKLTESENNILAYSGVRHHYNRNAEEKIEGYPLQMVQVLHRRIEDRWLERKELVTDDLDKMYWNKLSSKGEFVPTKSITCEWVDHPQQRHKIIQEPIGGINPYKLFYNVKEPLKYHSTVGNFIDEVEYFKRFRERPDTPKSENGLKILLVGELAYNSERILGLEEQGHKLYGLWMKDPYWYNTVGPLPFGHVEDIPYDNWVKRVKEIKPDIIYGLLNWQAVPLAHEVLCKNPKIPFVWHFKEGPFICLEKGTWPQLIDLYRKSQGQIYTSPEMRDWFEQFLPMKKMNSFVFDGDLPKKEWCTDERSPLLSEQDGEIHTVVPGRPIGLHPETVAELGAQKIHLHFYGDFTHGQWKQWINRTMSLAPGFLHIHPNCTQENWVKEFSKYDAGWLHFFRSENNGELMRANWDDLNYPARMATLAVAGLPMLQRDNTGHIVATQTIIKEMDLGIFFNRIEDLGVALRDKENMRRLRENIWKRRIEFSFDYHVEKLTKFFKEIINLKK